MKRIDNAFERGYMRSLILTLKKDMDLSDSYTDNMEYCTEEINFARLNGKIVLANLEIAERELKGAHVRKSVRHWIREMIRGGRENLTEEFIISALSDFDDRNLLATSEIFLSKHIFVYESARIFSDALKECLHIQSMRYQAEKWLNEKNSSVARCDSIYFLEHALRLTHEYDKDDKRSQLEKRLEHIGKTQDDIIRIVSVNLSDILLRLTNSISIIHTVINMDWMKAFLEISHTEKILSSDPGNIYNQMDDESKACIRREIESISSVTGLNERSIASISLELVRSGAFHNICEVIYTDKGQKAITEQLGFSHNKLKKITPDPDGRYTIYLHAGISILLTMVLAMLSGVFLSVLIFPVIWQTTGDLIRFFASKIIKPHPLLSLELNDIPSELKTLVVIPALLTDEKSTEKVLRRLKEHAAHEDSKNVDFLLLGDYKDNKDAKTESDQGIFETAGRLINEMNSECEREKFFYLQRERSFNASDSIWMGRERKRGALEDLNRLLTMVDNRFLNKEAADTLSGNRYKYVITLDADTRMLPGTIHKLIGAIAHPVNSRYSLLQPRMENLSPDRKNLFVNWMAGHSGCDHYDVCASDYFQDVTGEGLFSGKGIYDIEKFYCSTSEAFQENTILSHDMIEGILSKAAYDGKTVLYESFPESISSYLKRLDRWTRGDWQLVFYLWGKIKLTKVSRYKIISNLLRSLRSSSEIVALVLGAWLSSPLFLTFGLLSEFLPFFLFGFTSLKPIFMRLIYLPSIAFCEIRAALIALTRIYITKKKRLEWVTAAESGNHGKKNHLPGILVSGILIPGLCFKEVFLITVFLMVIFCLGSHAVELLHRNDDPDRISTEEYAYLTQLSRSIWKYFEKHVPLDGNGLPPDNVQLDPPIGVQNRTSPTNIGMYLLSVLSAFEIGIIERSEMLIRIERTLATLENLKTHKGLHYNWYDISSCMPVTPKYISSVDCGNLLAALITVRNFLSHEEKALSERLESLVKDMDLRFLYNEKRKLFSIGYDAENDVISRSHYDLYSSEARILSFSAIAEKKVPLSHWKALSRPFAYHKGKSYLLSWSGTMFEYFMPNLLLPSPFASLNDQSLKCVIYLQKQKANDGVWGISESGYHAFDQALNYQYKAFGLSKLALSGQEDGKVYSPYSVLLALEHDTERAVDCLKVMQTSGLRGDMGFYEAFDTSLSEPRIVYSYMTHHQGMSFISLANLITNFSIRRHFLSHPNESSLLPILDEKPFIVPLMKRIAFRKEKCENLLLDSGFIKKTGDRSRIALKSVFDGHMIFAGGTEACFDQSGCCFMKRGEIFANTWHFGFYGYEDSLLPVIEDESGKARIDQVVYDTGSAVYNLSTALVRYTVTYTIDPENGSLLFHVKCENVSIRAIDASVTSRFRIALSGENQFLSHPIFSDLFVRSERTENGFIHARLDRNTRKYCNYLYHLSDGEFESNADHFHSKHSVIVRKLHMLPGEKCEIVFEIGIRDQIADNPGAASPSKFHRAMILSRAQMNAHISFSGLTNAEYRHIDRLTTNFFRYTTGETDFKYDPKVLWPLGLSGEKPIMLVYAKGKSDLVNIRKMVRAHEYLRYAGVKTTLVILCLKETEYFTPLKDAISGILHSSHLRHCISVENGVSVLHDQDITLLQKKHLLALSVFTVERDFYKDAVFKRYVRPSDRAKGDVKTLNAALNRDLLCYNGYGGIDPNTGFYEIQLTESTHPPRRWANFLVNDQFGAIVTDMGISLLYHENSAFGRITPFDNDVDDTKSFVRLTSVINGQELSLTPVIGKNCTVSHYTGKTVYRVCTDDIDYESTCFTDLSINVFYVITRLKSKKGEHTLRLYAQVDFLMGTDVRDQKFTSVKKMDTCTVAHGKCGFSVFAGFENPNEGSGGMEKDISFSSDKEAVCVFCIGALIDGETPDTNGIHALQNTEKYWEQYLGALTVTTGSQARDLLMNGFIKDQTICSRFYARSGLYQPGGAFGLRDQLQDALSILYFNPSLTKSHILLCASRQFEDGDGMHWWHMPRTGVRTKITDDMLFLSYACAEYMRFTADTSLLTLNAPYLRNRAIPEGESDLYFEAEETDYKEPLYDHIMRSFRYTLKKGAHGLLLMGGGDWNDGMNKVGAEGMGESVWLSEFWIFAAEQFIPYANDQDKTFLLSEIISIRKAIETHAWDGKWYLRAYHDTGEKIGSNENQECRIDLITQAWACLSGLDKERCSIALDSVKEHLIDKDSGLIRLLDPPFSVGKPDPGYISAYPKGVRENGGQYTHAACWLVKAFCKMNMADDAWNAFDMLLPINRTDTREKAAHYGGEPYVIAADISSDCENKGACGWTWYTGAAGWAQKVLYEDLLGLRIEGNRVSMNALLKSGMDEARITYTRNATRYTLISRRNPDSYVDYYEFADDGKAHEIVFISRN